MRFFIFFLSCCLSLSSLAAYAEDGVKAYMQRESIWKIEQIVVDGKTYDRHFFSGFSDLPDAMKANSEAFEYVERARIQNIWASSFFWTGLAASAVYYSTPDATISGGWNIFLVGLLPAIFLIDASRVNTLRAINAYNGVHPRYSDLKPAHFFVSPSTQGSTVAGLSWSF